MKLNDQQFKELLDDIRSHADIAFVIGNYIEVIQKGRNYTAMCPFHNDHNPSLHIDVAKQTFMCYVCKTGGDVFTFVQKFKKISFMEAVKEVAKICNYNDPRLEDSRTVTKQDTEIAPLYNCITDLQKYYQYALNTEEGDVAKKYLADRHITEEQVEKFGLGYSLRDGKITINYLKSKGYSIKTIADIGISSLSSGQMSDANAGRLIFPIKNASGQVLGFSARKLVSGGDDPKYVNSPETKLFHKGMIFYNYNNARESAKQDGYLYITEGFMDVFALDSIGFTSVVALMGTKLTSDHINELKRLNVEVRLCLDGDAAGQKGMMAIMPMLDAANISYRVVSVPGELRDPDEILKQDGPEALRKFVTTLVDPFTFALNYYENTSPLGSREDSEKVIRHFAPMLLSTNNKLVYNDYLIKLSKVTGFEVLAIQEFIKNTKRTVNNSEPVDDVYVEPSFEDLPEEAVTKLNTKKNLRRLQLTEKAVILLMLYHKDAALYYERHINYFIDKIYHQLSLYILDYYETHDELDVNSVMDVINLADDENKDELISTLSLLTMEKHVPAYTNAVIKEFTDIIADERNKISNEQELKDDLAGKTESEKVKKMKEFLEKKKKQIEDSNKANKTLK
ncbi:MAG: DNA primase [Bacilli bacterium]|nr:DNA primase [Bacilli bacterium]